MAREHRYQLALKWTGNRGTGTSGYRDYGRDHEISAEGKVTLIQGSSDPAFRGDASRYSPEDLLVASLSTCHMLWFLHLCADAGIIVMAYSDTPTGTMAENADGSGHFTNVTLRPRVMLADKSRAAETAALHEKAHHLCFIARSVNFPVEHEADVEA